MPEMPAPTTYVYVQDMSTTFGDFENINLANVRPWDAFDLA